MRKYVDEHRVVVWYDGEVAFGSLAEKLELRDCVVISAGGSRLVARRQADEAFLAVANAGPGEAGGLLIYVPQARGVEEAERVADIFECFAVAGTAFGDQESERLQSLARQAMPQAGEEIDRLFADGKPTLRTLDGLEKSSGYPLLKQALGTEAPIEIGAKILADEASASRLDAVEGSSGELTRLLQTEFGFESADGVSTSDLCARFARYSLVSELAAACGDAMPDSLQAQALAIGDRRDALSEACTRARNDATLRERYLQVADEIEEEFSLAAALAQRECAWTVDTFACQDTMALRRAAALVEAGKHEDARVLLDARRSSVWLTDPERHLLWRALERCIEFREVASAVAGALPGKKSGVSTWFGAYCADAGLWRLDRLQRLVEQAYAECLNAQPLDGVIEACRTQYRTVAERLQDGFLAAVESEGWPPANAIRATQSYERAMAPSIDGRERVVYFLVDAIRYEMARDLAQGLGSLGEIALTPTAASLPTTTAVGMAALMPGADGSLRLDDADGEAVPAIGQRALGGSAQRMDYLRSILGDRFDDITLSSLLSLTEKKAKALFGEREALVVRTQDIDELGEGTNLLMARDMMSTVLTRLRKATDLLIGLGYRRFVYAADHGHVLLPEIPPGDVVVAPAGSWLLSKRRCRLGTAHTSVPGTLRLEPNHVGLDTSAPDFVVPTGMRVFAAGGGYFHEGISLQECALLLLVLDAGERGKPAGEADIHIAYKSDRFTSRVISVKVTYMNLLEPQIDVRVEAFDRSGAKAQSVGHAVDCEARNEATGLVRLMNGEETQVPVLLKEAVGDSVEIRATDPVSGRVLDTLTLKKNMLE